MDVTFTKVAGRRYLVNIVRSVGPELAARNGPGYDPYLPHDLVHFVVEAEAGIRGGVFGRLATGDSGFFWPVDQRELRRRTRHKRVPTADERADMARSEWLAGICPRIRKGAGSPSGESLYRPAGATGVGIPAGLPAGVDLGVVEQICARLDEVAERWHALPVGGEIALTWPYAEGHRRPPRNPRRRATTRRAAKPPAQKHR